MGNTDRGKIGLTILIPRSYKSSEENRTGSWRFLRPRYQEKTAPCSSACPVAQDIPRIQMLTVQGAFKEAWDLLLRENPFPGVCGRVCFHPCEQACNRREFDEAVAVHVIERFLADTASRYGLQPTWNQLPDRGKRVAIVGSGPAGLSAAYFLALLGYSCDVFESAAAPGGMLRWAIPLYRLPLEVLSEEISRVESLGVKIHCNHPVDQEMLASLKRNYDAVFLACGHQKGKSLNIPGEDLPGVEDGLEFLKQLRTNSERLTLDGRIAVVGGGNTALDVARCVIRCGGEPIIVYRRRREDMKAFEEEIKMALEEGVEILELKYPSKVEKKGRELVLSLQGMKVSDVDADGRAVVEPEPGNVEELGFSKVFVAIGTEPAEDWLKDLLSGDKGMKLPGSSIFFEDGVPVFFTGDLGSSRKTVTDAIFSGKESAAAFDIYVGHGKDSILPLLESCRVGGSSPVSMEIYLNGKRRNRSSHVVSYDEINPDYFSLVPRIPQPRLLGEERVNTFSEIDLKIAASMAMKEAGRCFNCGICNHCDNCYFFCPEIAVFRDSIGEGQSRSINYEYCKGCGLCVVECPRNAMVLEEESA